MLRRWAMAAAFATLAIAPGPAHAAWYRVETDRFIVYGEGNEKAARDYATRLTIFDSVLRRFHPSTRDRVARTKVQVYLVANEDQLKKVNPNLGPYVLGFYSAMNEGVFAVAIKSQVFGGDDVLFHEYAHHFMLENFPAAYPAWFVEGWAEYFMTTDIRATEVRVGGYNEARVYGIFQTEWLPLAEILTKTVWETRKERRDIYYAQSWLLMHYMRDDAARSKQMDAAILAISKGENPVKAFEAATGKPLEALTAELKKYRRLQTFVLKGAQDVQPQMTVTTLPRSADDLVLDNVRLILWQTGRPDADELAAVRRKAAKYPGDPLAETTLARAEFVLGEVTAGEAIVQRRLAANPNAPEDLLLAGTGQLLAGFREKDQRQDRFRAARPFLLKAYNLDKGDFRTLFAYAMSRQVEPVYPNDNDINALLEARTLAPAVMDTSIQAGFALIARGRKDEAARVLAPVINSPHGGPAAAAAKRALSGNMAGPGELDLDTDEDEPAPKT
jgi:hypothetical protein